MHSQVFAERNHKSQTSLVDQCAELVKRFDLDPSYLDNLQPKGRLEPEVRALLQREAILDVITGVLEASGAIVVPEVLEKAGSAEVPGPYTALGASMEIPEVVDPEPVDPEPAPAKKSRKAAK